MRGIALVACALLVASSASAQSTVPPEETPSGAAASEPSAEAPEPPGSDADATDSPGAPSPPPPPAPPEWYTTDPHGPSPPPPPAPAPVAPPPPAAGAPGAAPPASAPPPTWAPAPAPPSWIRHAPPDRRDRGAGRVGVELLGGILGYAIGGFLSGALGCGVGLVLDDDLGCAFGAIFGGIAGAGVGVAIGVKTAGDAMGGNGSFSAAYWGQFLGGLMSLGTLPFAFESDGGTIAMLVAATVFPIAGGIIGYEISHDPEEQEQSRPVFITTLTPTRDGAAAHIAATF